MGLFSNLFKKKNPVPPVPTPQTVADTSNAASRPNSGNVALLNTRQTPAQQTAHAAPKKSFGAKSKEVLSGVGSWLGDKAVRSFDWVRDRQDDFHDLRKAVGKKIKAAYEGSTFQKGVNAVKGVGSTVLGGIKSAGGWIAGKAKGAAKAIKDSKFGQGVAKAGKMAWGGLKTAGGWIADKAKSAAKAVANSKFGQGVAKVGKKVWGGLKTAGGWAADKAKSAAKFVKESKFGQGVAKVSSAVGSAYKKASGWVRDKKEGIANWGEDMAQKIREHDDDRYLAHQMKKRGASGGAYLNRLVQTQADMGQGDIGENIRMRADVSRLGRYDDETRSYQDAAAAPSAAPAQAAEPGRMTQDGIEGVQQMDEDVQNVYGGISGAVEDTVDNYNSVQALRTLAGRRRDPNTEYNEFDLGEQGIHGARAADILTAGGTILNSRQALGGAADTVGHLRAGNRQEAVMSGMDTFGSAADAVLGATGLDGLPAVNAGRSAYDVMTNAVRTGIHGHQKRSIDSIDEADLHQGIDGDTNEGKRDQRLMTGARDAMSSQLSRNMVEDVSGMVQGTISTGGSIADVLGAGGIGSAVAHAVNVPVGIGTKMITGHMRNKDNKRIAKRDLFGSEENYSQFKHDHGLNKREMQILMRRKTGSRTIGDIADRARTEQAQTVHRYLGQENSGAHHLMKGMGYRTLEGREGLSSEDIAEKTGVARDLKSLERRRLRA